MSVCMGMEKKGRIGSRQMDIKKLKMMTNRASKEDRNLDKKTHRNSRRAEGEGTGGRAAGSRAGER